MGAIGVSARKTKKTKMRYQKNIPVCRIINRLVTEISSSIQFSNAFKIF